FLFSAGVFTSPEEDAETASPAGKPLGPFDRFLGLLGLDDEYLRWWKRPLGSDTESGAATAFGAWAAAVAEVVVVNNDVDDCAAAEATRRTVSGSMMRFAAEASTDV